MSPGLLILILILAAWIVVILAIRILLVPILRSGPGADPVTGILWWTVRGYMRWFHRASYRGQDEIRTEQFAGPLIVVSNHTGAVDPLLVQSGCRFHIRWLMAANMMTSGLDWLWKVEQMIPVARDGTDSGPLREAIKHVKAGGVIGIFPEGRIVTPPRQVWPFHPGIGLMVSRTKARVLLCWVSGTPDTPEFSQGLTTRSNARVEYLDLIDFGGERNAETITRSLRERIAEVSGWPIQDEIPPPVEVSEDPFGV